MNWFWKDRACIVKRRLFAQQDEVLIDCSDGVQRIVKAEEFIEKNHWLAELIKKKREKKKQLSEKSFYNRTKI